MTIGAKLADGQQISARPVLAVRDLTVRYGGLVAVSGANLEVRPGQLVGLVGPNGAGKTTMIDAICGLARAEGKIIFGEQPLQALPCHRRAQAGLVRTFQSLELFDDLTVRENVIVAAAANRRRATGASPEEVADEALRTLELTDVQDRLPRELSQGRRKLVGVARALGSSPTCLLLDEPAGGLDSHESHTFGKRLRGLVQQGVSALLIEHDMGLVFDVCDYIYVLEFGKIISSGTPDKIRQDKHVIAAYLGAGASKVVDVTGDGSERR